MQTVPSLAGTGAAVAAAATGLVFGHGIEPDPISTNSIRPFSSKPRASFHDTRATAPRPLSHAGASASAGASHAPPSSVSQDAPCHPLPSRLSPYSPLANGQRHTRTLNTHHVSTPQTGIRRQSLVFPNDIPATTTTPPIPEDPRDSFSSSSSWIRRLSMRPLSQHESPHSSLAPDSPSLSLSHTSGAPILSPTLSAPPPLPPNKLVKRAFVSSGPAAAPAAAAAAAGTLPLRSKTNLPSLRRPATSHQRSATLQQHQYQQYQQHQQLHQVATASPLSPKFSLDHSTGPRRLASPAPVYPAIVETYEPAGWSSFFHSQMVKVTARPGRPAEFSPASRISMTSRRIRTGVSRRIPYLIRPAALTSPPAQSVPMFKVFPAPAAERATPDQDDPEQQEDSLDATPDEAASRATRRSMSMPFPSPTSWIHKSGSIRRIKRLVETKADVKHHNAAAAAPAAPAGASSDLSAQPHHPDRHEPPAHVAPVPDPAYSTTNSDALRRRDSQSPLVSLSGLSSFSTEISRLGPPAPIMPGQSMTMPRQHQPSGSSHASSAFGRMTINSCDSEARCFTSTDDDETDFKSETVWDSIRTGASCRIRAADTPLESLFDDSPPSPAGNGNAKIKWPPIQETLGRCWDNESKITEEDEGVATPVRRPQGSVVFDTHAPAPAPDPDLRGTQSHSPARLSLSKEPTRLSLDDDFDDDWARDGDDPLYSPLSPPSKGSSVNSRGISPHVRIALANINGNSAASSGQQRGTGPDRPLSSLFDWHQTWPDGAEPAQSTSSVRSRSTVNRGDSVADKGARLLPLRRGPTSMHARSLSVPIPQELPDGTKSAGSKFGTWGLGSKGVSEDWDDDFDFESSGNGPCSKAGEKVFAVPASIQATQPSVKAHSGQLKEISVIVTDLKRLCGHGRDLGLLMTGPHLGLWKEAEGIIALASPDDDGGARGGLGPRTQSATTVTTVTEFDAARVGDRFVDDGFDPASLQTALEEIPMSRTAVVRDRPSPRRRSVFGPDDDIFGGNWPLTEELERAEPAKTVEVRPASREPDVSAAVQSVVEAVHRKASRDRGLPSLHSDGKLHFGTNSLKALVKRASDVRDALADLIHAHTSPVAAPAGSSFGYTARRSSSNNNTTTNNNNHNNNNNSSSSNSHEGPAFTRVFTAPSTPPHRRLPQSHSANSVLGPNSLDVSPSGVGQCMQQMMTVS